MEIEYEAKFTNINKDKIRIQLKEIGAVLKKPEFLQKRVTFNFPSGHEIKGAWARVRDEGDKITTSLKIVNGDRIEDQKEIMLKIDNFENAVQFLATLGCVQKSYQENKRELWVLNDTEITIDEWPFLEPFIEIEGKSKQNVRNVAEKLGFNWQNAVFGSTHLLTSRKYNIPEDILNNEIARIVFDEDNPYLKWLNEHKS